MGMCTPFNLTPNSRHLVCRDRGKIFGSCSMVNLSSFSNSVTRDSKQNVSSKIEGVCRCCFTFQSIQSEIPWEQEVSTNTSLVGASSIYSYSYDNLSTHGDNSPIPSASIATWILLYVYYACKVWFTFKIFHLACHSKTEYLFGPWNFQSCFQSAAAEEELGVRI